MTDMDEIVFTRQEVLSFLPTGWGLPPDELPGRWNAAEGRWSVTVHDLADQVWELSVDAAAVRELGRAEALRRATRGIQRRALGRRGLFG